MNLLDRIPADAQRALASWVRDRGEPAYRVRQIFPRLWQRPVGSWSDVTDIPHRLIDALTEDFPISRPRLETRQDSADGTMKFLWLFDRDTAVESVLIPEDRRQTLCISSQAGCAYGCVFCATGRMGFQRHLAPWEITAQVRELALDPELGAPTNIVFMGMGEPLHNWAAVDVALTILNAVEGFGIGARRITVSTIGLVPALEQLANRPEQFRIALSLHAPFHERRLELMPVERKYPLERVLHVLQRFPRRVTFEYVMIAGVNDAQDDAVELARLARGLGAMVNLLPLHPGGAPGLRPTAGSKIRAFAQRLRSLGANATVRRSRGLDISAACGQLRTTFTRDSEIQTQQHAHIE